LDPTISKDVYCGDKFSIAYGHEDSDTPPYVKFPYNHLFKKITPKPITINLKIEPNGNSARTETLNSSLRDKYSSSAIRYYKL